MRKLTVTLIIIASFNLYGQFVAEDDWPISFKNQFNQLTKQNVDTLLVYYLIPGAWPTHPDNCYGVNSIWILWTKNKNCYAREYFCDSSMTGEIMNITSMPIRYFVEHIKDYDLNDRYSKKLKHQRISTDGSWEHLILMTSRRKINLNLASYQYDERWSKYKWIKTTIKAIDTLKYELKFKK